MQHEMSRKLAFHKVNHNGNLKYPVLCKHHKEIQTRRAHYFTYIHTYIVQMYIWWTSAPQCKRDFPLGNTRKVKRIGAPNAPCHFPPTTKIQFEAKQTKTITLFFRIFPSQSQLKVQLHRCNNNQEGSEQNTRMEMARMGRWRARDWERERGCGSCDDFLDTLYEETLDSLKYN